MTDELETRLRRADPAASAPVRPADGADARVLRRAIMERDDEMPVTEGGRPPANGPWWRQPLVLSAVGAAAAAAIVITVVAQTSDDPPPSAASTETYELPGGDGIIQSCLPIADIDPIPGAAALAGTVVSVDGNQVVLDVDRWYAGGDAERVELQGTNQNVALDGVDFVVGEDYLVTAADGIVQVCGMSGPATPELEQIYDEWYG